VHLRRVVGAKGLPIVISVEFLIAVQAHLVLQFLHSILQLLVLELCSLKGDSYRIFLLQQCVIGFPKLLLLDVGEGIEVGLPHGPEGVELVLDLLVRLDDLLYRTQSLLVFLLVGTHHNKNYLTIFV